MARKFKIIRRGKGFIERYRVFNGHRILVREPIGKPISLEEFDRRTRPFFLKMAKRIEELEKQGKRIPRRV